MTPRRRPVAAVALIVAAALSAVIAVVQRVRRL